MELRNVILVDEQDKEVGTMEKMETHQKGILHRAFSVFVFNSKGEMLLQQRALNKYHSAGLWTNSCCSHPGPGEVTADAAARRLQEEMGFTTPLEKLFDFVYRIEFNNGMTEHEFDHVYAGEYDGEIILDRHEVMDYCFKNMVEVRNDLREQPDKFTTWFKLAFPRVEAWWAGRYNYV
ncbi:MAG: isopentenyl-diphosphate Delta-isomerase [Chitinophagaceae bacterium]|nr:isopentenyl-diphosphate Delta-isomerase [Chitinophagaceae bacterium]